MADLAAYNPDEAAELELIGIDGTPLLNDDGSPMTISLLGEDSAVAESTRNANTNRRFEASRRGAATLTAEAIGAEEATYFAKLTVGWKLKFGPEELPFSQDAARKLYRDRKMSFVTDQVREFVRTRKNFLRPA